MRKIFILTILLVSAAACSKTDFQERDRAIRLALSVDDIDVTTRAVEADPYVGAAFSKEHPFNTDVWFTLAPGVYSHDPDQELSIPVHTTLSHTGSDGTDAMYEGKNIMYPLDENQVEQNPVFCVGFYPANEAKPDENEGMVEWNNNNWIQDSQDDNVVTHAITGQQDLMFADLMKGNYNTNFGTQEFKHLLTWVKINVIATSVEAANAWGMVNSLSIEGSKNTVQIKLTDTFGASSDISFIGVPFTLQTVDEGNPKELNIRGTLAGSVLCCPPGPKSETDATVGYWISVQTVNVSEPKKVFVPITWEDPNDADSSGKLLIINLYFNEVSVVSGVCSLSYWENTSEDLFLEKVE